MSDSLQPMDCSTPGFLSFTVSQSLFKLMFIESVMPSNHLILCRPLLFLPSIFPSLRVFSNESALLIRCSKYWSFNFSIRPSNEYSGLVSFLPWPPRLHSTLCPSLTSVCHSPHSALATGYFLILDHWTHSQCKVLEISDLSSCTFLPRFPIHVSFLKFSYLIKYPFHMQLSQSP